SGSSGNVSASSVTLVAKQNVNASLIAEIEKLESKIKTASGSEVVALQKELAQKSDDVNQPAPAAFAYEAVAEKEPNYENWVKAGDRFAEGYHDFADTSAVQGLVQKAIGAYSKALELN